MTIDLDAIEARAKAATPGPWDTDGNGYDIYIGAPFGSGVMVADRMPNVMRARGTGGGISDDEARANMRFCAAARTDVPALVAEVRTLRSRLAAVERNESNMVEQFKRDLPDGGRAIEALQHGQDVLRERLAAVEGERDEARAVAYRLAYRAAGLTGFAAADIDAATRWEP